MWWTLVAFGIFGGIILWELSTGIALDARWRGHRRAEDPGTYWRIVGGQIASLLCVWLVWWFVR